MSPFKAFLIDQKDGKTIAGFTDFKEDQLDKGEVTIKVAYSSVNYKDALAATGAGRIIRRYPCVGGIDMAGTVAKSTDARFKEGDQVIATSYDIGVAHHGGYAEYGRVPADWVVPLPKGLSLFDAMALGTAGYTAGLGVVRMEENGLAPANGKVIVSGATGGVGSIAIDILSRLGYEVVALTGKESQTEYLKGLGAKEVMLRSSLDLSKIKPLDRALWAGAVDNLGGEVLAWMASTMQQNGVIASIGLAASMSLNTTVAPFILRGASLLGIDSGYTAMPLRRKVWERLAGDMRPAHLSGMTRTVKLDDLPPVFDAFIKGQAHGRVVVDCGG
ncbi:MAG: oxidoreductase [Burkholderiales bacterium]|nr:Acrylyl-CoA reductase AcuI [Rhodocyclaceae bacterium]MCZ2419323.1 oxidoreductase [Burkholderiales bacterium]